MNIYQSFYLSHKLTREEARCQKPILRNIQKADTYKGNQECRSDLLTGESVHQTKFIFFSTHCSHLHHYGFLELTELKSSSKTMTESKIVSANLEGVCGHLVIFLWSVLFSHFKALHNLS